MGPIGFSVFLWLEGIIALSPSQKYFQREAGVFILHVGEGFDQETKPSHGHVRIALESFMKEVTKDWDREARQVHIYTLAHILQDSPRDSMLRTFHHGSFSQFFPSWGLYLLESVNVNIMEYRGIISDERLRCNLAGLFRLSSSLGLLSEEIRPLMKDKSLEQKIDHVKLLLEDKMTERHEIIRDIQIELGILPAHAKGNVALPRFITVLRQDPISFLEDDDVFHSWVQVKDSFFRLLHYGVDSNVLENPTMIKIVDALSDIIDNLAFIDKFEQPMLDLFRATCHAVSTAFFDNAFNDMGEFNSLAARISAAVESFRRRADVNEMKRLLNEIDSFSETSIEASVSIVPELRKLVKFASSAYLSNLSHTRRFASSLFFRRRLRSPAVHPEGGRDVGQSEDKNLFVKAIVRASIWIIQNPENKPLVGLGNFISVLTTQIDSLYSSSADEDTVETLILETCFQFRVFFGVNLLRTYPKILPKWSPERIMAVRDIIASFLLFGEREWVKLLEISVGFSTLKFVSYLRKVKLRQLEKAVAGLRAIRQSLTCMYKRKQFTDAPLVSPSEWLKLFLGQWVEGFLTTVPSEYSKHEESSNLGVLATSFSNERSDASSRRPPVPLYDKILDQILLFLPDERYPKDVMELSREISDINKNSWSVLTKGDLGLELKKALQFALDLPRIVYQLQVELRLIDAEGEEQTMRRESLILAARALFNVFTKIASIGHIPQFGAFLVFRCSRNLGLVLQDLWKAQVMFLFKRFSIQWTGRAVFRDKFETLHHLTANIIILQEGIRNNVLAFPDGLCNIPSMPPSWIIPVPI